MILTAGTVTYEIPLPSPYELKWNLPLFFSEDDAGVVIECPAFAEYGYGKNREEALKDLGQSIVSFWESLKHLKKRRRNMGEAMACVFDNMAKYIIKKEGR